MNILLFNLKSATKGSPKPLGLKSITSKYGKRCSILKESKMLKALQNPKGSEKATLDEKQSLIDQGLEPLEMARGSC